MRHPRTCIEGKNTHRFATPPNSLIPNSLKAPTIGIFLGPRAQKARFAGITFLRPQNKELRLHGVAPFTGGAD